ncbi:hypothetical protein BS47DRAFT_1363790 [Hydnum rufescens UP504]|uniref:Uncharacterized protein n=1 Tax=Hydnum rufescens UP504 TaxID=1448309 RepID=A0A9P6DQX2_9AGAM|nr:hypothetical protein BS47DRAFT_1363790 [Hydnum rufescens UP504]
MARPTHFQLPEKEYKGLDHFVMSHWNGVFLPASTPKPRKFFQRHLKSPKLHPITHRLLQLSFTSDMPISKKYHTSDHGWFANDITTSPLTLIHAQIINIKFHFNQEDTTSEPPTTPNTNEANTNNSDSHKVQSSHNGFNSKSKDPFTSVFLHLLVEEKVDPETCLRAIFVRTLQDYDLDT